MHEGFHHDEVEAIGNGIDENKKIAQCGSAVHGVVFAISYKAYGANEANGNAEPLQGSCLLFQHENGERSDNHRGKNHDDGGVKGCGDGQSIEEAELIDGDAAQTAE